ncbi:MULTISPECIES: hypothetical protein [unclassified Bradyrhizobium]|uniref:hypothetical protein n=1 Tax=unclassified Bradyrhizobium TaxID=2631580 RepID=UPI001BAC2A89|nr:MULTISPECIES: hypothetical protein [unclassified Bradyrhizobium]MBR1208761.1 hypothetical protein [Bradyrhizobium sp. AUGA SZCCT0124]MBR1316954.1 hypothetical protein [Bradyrhizobium sp. AUGA SZCCT0051]MBR1345250.1 hypothetical protein [Bradyrhizobium sp. AUGA SZCCT0105]MBR1360048.1 hypothetical protein [Bradyrhizobium sp. AUGA SZCCT0045]
MLDEVLARIRAHRNNIHRYRRLLRTKLSELKPQFIERRLAEEQTALDPLAADTFPADTIALDEARAVAAIRRMRKRFKKPEMTPAARDGACGN